MKVLGGSIYRFLGFSDLLEGSWMLFRVLGYSWWFCKLSGTILRLLEVFGGFGGFLRLLEVHRRFMRNLEGS